MKTRLFAIVLVAIGVFTSISAYAESGPVYVVPIRGEINPSLTVFLRRSIETARNDDASHIVFDIDTFGGRVDSALQIANLIGSLNDITTIAYVMIHPDGTGVSWSAGALISFASDAIYMAPGTSMGAAAPVLQSPEGGMTLADEKTVSAVRTQMAALAEKNGYERAIALAMVDQDLEILEVTTNGMLRVLTRAEFETLMRRAGDADVVEEGPVVSESGKLLTLTAGEMERYAVSSGTVSTRLELFDALGVADAKIVDLQPTTADELVAALTGAGFTSLLILAGILALFMEITSPGFGVPGTVAIVCFAIIFSSNFLLGTVGSGELLLFVVGVVLLILEIFIIPGFGVAGISGIAMIAISLILSMQDFVLPTFQWEWDLFHRNVLLVIGNIVGAFLAFGAVAYFMPKFTFFNRIALATAQATADGYSVQSTTESDTLVGRTGVAVTTLRPSGKAEIGDDVLQVESEGEFIDANTSIKVIAVNGNRVIVRRV